MKFHYHKYNLSHPFNKTKQLLRPIIPVSIKYRNTSLYFEALIDSGSDFNIFPEEVAERLDVDLKNKRKIHFSGIENNLNVGFIVNVTLSIGHQTVSTKVVFSKATSVAGILGQYGFFDKFKVNFNLEKSEIEIKTS